MASGNKNIKTRYKLEPSLCVFQDGVRFDNLCVGTNQTKPDGALTKSGLEVPELLSIIEEDTK